MAEPYSGLEVASAEHTQQSPELVDHSADAPERTLVPNSPDPDRKWPLPVSQSSPVHLPLTLRLTTIQSPNPEDRALSPGVRSDVKSSRNSHDAPESDAPWSPRPQTYLSSDNETLKEMVIPKSDTPAAVPEGEKGRPRRRRRMLWILIALIAFLAIAIGVGVGVGVGVTRNKSSKSARYSTLPCYV